MQPQLFLSALQEYSPPVKNSDVSQDC